MNLLPVLLFILYPLSPALRLFEFVRWFLGRVLIGFEDEAYVAELEEDPEELAKLNRWLCDMEGLVHIVIGYMARDKLGLPFRDHHYRNTGNRAEARTAKPLVLMEVFNRFERITFMLPDIERLAIRRAWRLKKQLDANPLGLMDHKPAEAGPGAASQPLARAVVVVVVVVVEFCAPRIRAPPWRVAFSENQPRSNPQTSSARTRPHALTASSAAPRSPSPLRAPPAP